jgi:hypothetical protein
MEPFEWLVLGIGLAIGGVMGANGKGVMRSAARGYLVVGEKTREWTGNMREDFQDAIEEARYDREESEYESEREQEPRERGRTQEHKRPASRSRSTARGAAAPKTRRAPAKASGDSKSDAGAKAEAS